MLRGYRSIVLAAFAGLILANGQIQAGVHKEGSQTEQRQANKSPPPEATPANQVEHAARYNNPCRYSDTRDDSDLCAQWRAANAAQGQLDWTVGTQFTLDVVGALGLALSLILSAMAAIAGLKAYSGFKGAERAHVFVSGMKAIGFFGDGVERKIGFCFTNRGATPCFVTGIHLEPMESLPRRPAKIRYEGSFLPIVPNEPTQMEREVDISPEDYSAFLRDGGRLWLVGGIKYKDIFGASHETRFAYEFSLNGPLNIIVPVKDLAYWRYT